jgi:hypothetical protein
MRRLREIIKGGGTEYHKRSNYAWGMLLCVAVSHSETGQMRERLASRSITGGSTLGIAVETGFLVTLALFGSAIIWRCISDIGVPNKARILWLAGLVASWGWFLIDGPLATLALGLFVAFQAPLLAIAGKRGATPAEAGPLTPA